ncbi:MAG: hypothetical protein HN637_14920 [Gammaproteobacteria bacterium]|nr:hypothetical protein [Gammaproteobacteria bacterium]
MSNKTTQGRRRFLTGIGVVATGATVAATAQAAQSSEHQNFVPARHDEDTWLDANSAGHRVFLDSSTTSGGVTALNYANNILPGHADGYGGSDSDYSIVVCFRHQSTPLGYNDAMWAKYGEALSGFMGFNDPRTDAPFMTNPVTMDRSDMSNRGNTIDKLIARGVSYAICQRATRAVSGFLARATGGSSEDIYQELSANNVPNSRFVAAGVVAATRSQEYGYSLLYSA